MTGFVRVVATIPYGHTSAALMIANHQDLKIVSKRLDHAQASTTMNIYAHALPESDRKAAYALEAMLKGNKMKAIVINGSPRKSWNTDMLLRQALRGAADAGAETRLIQFSKDMQAAYDIGLRLASGNAKA